MRDWLPYLFAAWGCVLLGVVLCWPFAFRLATSRATGEELHQAFVRGYTRAVDERDGDELDAPHPDRELAMMRLAVEAKHTARRASPGERDAA